jgi:predicted transcriptional regulator
MSVAEIKKTKSNLIAWIEQLSDSNMLTVLDSIRNTKSQKDWYEDLSQSQKQHIKEGLDDEKNGHIMTSEKFWQNLKNG